jgi:hypothetical protein
MILRRPPVPSSVASLGEANDSIAWISGYETEADVDAASRQIVHYFGLESYVFGAMHREDSREHYRYLVGCTVQWCYLYTQNRWYAIDPFIDYARNNTAPILASEVEMASEGQQRMMTIAAEHGFRSGIVVPAHSSAAVRIGVLYLGTEQGEDHVRESYIRNRSLLRAFALELLEWWDTRLRDDNLLELALDGLDLDLLQKAKEGATAEEAAHELGVTLSRVRSRYERLNQKLQVRSKRSAVEKAVALGLIKGDA